MLWVHLCPPKAEIMLQSFVQTTLGPGRSHKYEVPVIFKRPPLSLKQKRKDPLTTSAVYLPRIYKA